MYRSLSLLEAIIGLLHRLLQPVAALSSKVNNSTVYFFVH